MSKLYLVGARAVLPDRVLEDAALVVEDGLIAQIDPEFANCTRQIDLTGTTLIPGLVDLHCDALEKEVEPRPGVFFPVDFACAQADRRNAAAGVTTVFHALSFARAELGVRNNAIAAAVVRAVHAWRPHALVDNRVHCRYEVTDAEAPASIQALMQEGQVQLLSLMDHTPGQGQFKDIAAFRAYLARTYGKSESELDALVAAKLAGAEGALDRIRSLVEAARARGIPVASHDDDTPQKIQTLRDLGVGISEFPVNAQAARAAREHGMHTVFGAPNVLRGASQSGSMRALEAIESGIADCLCADYHPASLLAAVFRLPELAPISLSAAVRLATCNPARAAGLADRGEIAVGQRADLVAVLQIHGLAQACKVFRAGHLVYQARNDGALPHA